MKLNALYYFYFWGFILIRFRCAGLSIASRIVSGIRVKENLFPWQVILQRSKKGSLYGAGSVISADWVLTAAHCTDSFNFIYLKFGMINEYDKAAAEMYSTDFYMHPKFNKTTLENDISLIKLPKSLKFSSLVKPIRLASYEDRYSNFVGNKAIITGFGYIDDDTPNVFGNLYYAKAVIISNRECKESYGQRVFGTTICSKGVKGSIQSICDGDSGGPLITKSDSGHLMQIGIISYSASETCSKNYPAAYARITSFLDFIEDTTNLYLK